MATPNLKEIEWAISELEGEETSKAGYILLAALHICRDHMLGDHSYQPQIAAYSEAAAPVDERLGRYGDSEFLQAVEGLDQNAAWTVMDEHMSALRVFNPRVYNGVMRKLSEM